MDIKGKKPEKLPMYVYCLVALVILFLLNFFLLPAVTERAVEQTDYTTFLEAVEEHKVEKAEVQDDYIYYTMKKLYDNHDKQKSINIYIPISNKLSCEPRGVFPIQFYGKRSKLISFCNRIQIIAKDFEYCSSIKEIQNLIEKTVNWCLSLDIWTIESEIPSLHYFFIEVQSIKQNNYVAPFAKKLMKRFSLDDEPFEVSGFTDLSYEDTIIYHTGNYLSQELSNLSGMLDSYVFSWYLP